MSWPFLYYIDDRLSAAELSVARLDGDLVEVGDAYMPADAVETRELRAASLRATVSPALVLTRESAAWVHGAVVDAPARHTVQRRTSTRLRDLPGVRLCYSDQALPAEATEQIGRVWVTTPGCTLADLVRALHAGEPVTDCIDALIRWRPGIVEEALTALGGRPRLHHKRAALAYLRARSMASG